MKTDRWPTGLLDILLALVLLTRLPLPRLPQDAFARGAQAVWAYPLAGGVLGGIAALVAAALLAVGLPPAIAAGALLAALALLSGAMHEDGLADTADGFWGAQDPARRLEIMKDSHIGSYGVLALILVTGLRWSAYTVLLPSGVLIVLVAAVLSRAPLPLLMVWLPQARNSGLSHSVGTPTWRRALMALALATGLSLAVIGPEALAALLGVLLVSGMVGLLARSKIGGQTGDVLGAAQQLCELAVLIAIIILHA